MNSEEVSLRYLILASTKMHLATRHALSALTRKVELLEKRLDKLEPESPSALKEARDELDSLVERSISEMDERAEDLLNALEVFANG